MTFTLPNVPLSQRALRAHREVVARREAEAADRLRRKKDDARNRWLMLLGAHKADDWHKVAGSSQALKITLDGLVLIEESRWRSGGGYDFYLRLAGDPEGGRISTLVGLGAAIERRDARPAR